MNDFDVYDTVEGWQLELGDQIQTVDSDDDTHHIEITDVHDSAGIRGQGYCHDHDQDCYFVVDPFEKVSLWTLTS